MAESTHPTDTPLDRALALAADALSARPAGLLTDFDGTLSPIVADPTLARLVDGASGALAGLVAGLAVVAIVTGRSPTDARRLVDVPGVLVSGNHGTEWLEPGASEPVPSPEMARIRPMLDAVLDRLPVMDGVIVEDKGISASVHYRNAPDTEATRLALTRAIGLLPPEIEARQGRMIFDIRPVGLGDKGSAARTIMERYGLRGVVVLGDDVTDLDMFAAVADARAAGKIRGAIVGVGGPDSEVHPDVANLSDVVLPSVIDAAELLARLAPAPA
ncbi:MAG: trehalose-phosphatase [Chloroflexota bacterium]|nr:trehalose-phosphatase [Chloroflexota bacterium]